MTPVNAPTVYDVYSQRKPFMIAEVGSVEDPTSPGRKGQWVRSAGADGFRTLAINPFFNTRK
jgi:hypothetical protein